VAVAYSEYVFEKPVMDEDLFRASMIEVSRILKPNGLFFIRGSIFSRKFSNLDEVLKESDMTTVFTDNQYCMYLQKSR